MCCLPTPVTLSNSVGTVLTVSTFSPLLYSKCLNDIPLAIFVRHKRPHLRRGPILSGISVSLGKLGRCCNSPSQNTMSLSAIEKERVKREKKN